MDELVFDIDKLAIEHYKHRLLMFIEKKENAEIKPILQKQTEGLLELLDEIYECFDKHDSDQRRNQWDRYVYVTCKALLMYKEDLEKSKNVMLQFGTETTSLSVRKIENHLERIESRINTLHMSISELEAHPHLSSF